MPRNPVRRGRALTARRCLVLLACVTLALAGCINDGQRSDDPSPAPPRSSDLNPRSDETQPLVEVQEPPGAPPQATFDDISVPVLSAEWFDPSTNEMQLVRPADDFDALDLTVVEADGFLDVSFHSPVAMSSIAVAFSTEIGPDGLPSGDVTEMTCTPVDGPCTFEQSNQSIIVRIPLPTDSRVGIVSVTYALLAADQERALDLGYAFDYVSYGVVLRQ